MCRSVKEHACGRSLLQIKNGGKGRTPPLSLTLAGVKRKPVCCQGTLLQSLDSLNTQNQSTLCIQWSDFLWDYATYKQRRALPDFRVFCLHVKHVIRNCWVVLNHDDCGVKRLKRVPNPIIASVNIDRKNPELVRCC